MSTMSSCTITFYFLGDVWVTVHHNKDPLSEDHVTCLHGAISIEINAQTWTPHVTDVITISDEDGLCL